MLALQFLSMTHTLVQIFRINCIKAQILVQVQNLYGVRRHKRPRKSSVLSLLLLLNISLRLQILIKSLPV